jgi:hypothetical protein
VQVLPVAASSLVAPLLDADPGDLTELARTRVSVWYATGNARTPWLCVCTPEAVRVPYAVLADRLPGVGLRWCAQGLCDAARLWRVTRWWRTPRPLGLRTPYVQAKPPMFQLPGVDADAVTALDPRRLVGAGPGLTPAGDDVLAAVLVTMRATADPRLADRLSRTRPMLGSRATTAVSTALLTAALDGYCCPELDRYLQVVCSGGEAASATRELTAVGHTSGTALRAGVWAVLASRHPVASVRRAA